MPRISPKNRKFADLIIAGETLADAYHKAISSKCTRESANVAGGRLKELTEVKAYIERVAARVEEKAIEAAALTMAERRSFLARVVRSKVGEITEASDLCQEYKIGKEGERSYKLPCKLRAIELDAKLSGELDEAPKTNIDLVVTPEMLHQLQQGYKELQEAVK